MYAPTSVAATIFFQNCLIPKAYSEHFMEMVSELKLEFNNKRFQRTIGLLSNSTFIRFCENYFFAESVKNIFGTLKTHD